MKTLRSLKFLLFGILLTATMYACKKDNPAPADYIPQGKWVGTYTFGANSTAYLAFDFKANHAMDAYSDANTIYDNSGYWTTYGNTLTAMVDGAIFKCEVNSKTGKITGTWGISPSETDGGTLSLTKQ